MTARLASTLTGGSLPLHRTGSRVVVVLVVEVVDVVNLVVCGVVSVVSLSVVATVVTEFADNVVTESVLTPGELPDIGMVPDPEVADIVGLSDNVFPDTEVELPNMMVESDCMYPELVELPGKMFPEAAVLSEKEADMVLGGLPVTPGKVLSELMCWLTVIVFGTSVLIGRLELENLDELGTMVSDTWVFPEKIPDTDEPLAPTVGMSDTTLAGVVGLSDMTLADRVVMLPATRLAVPVLLLFTMFPGIVWGLPDMTLADTTVVAITVVGQVTPTAVVEQSEVTAAGVVALSDITFVIVVTGLSDMTPEGAVTLP